MQPKTQRPLLLPGFWDVAVGLPAGMLIFMVTVLFSTLLSLRSSPPVYVPLLILAAAAMFSGLLSGITRLRRGPATGLVAGIIAALIFVYLWFAARPGEDFNPLVIGPPGVVTALCLSPLGGWLGARLRKAL